MLTLSSAHSQDEPVCRYVEPMPFAIEPSFNDSNAVTPLIFVLSAGSDPMASLLKFADDKGVRVEAVSLGQGQGPVAQEWISKGLKEGFWVVRPASAFHHLETARHPKCVGPWRQHDTPCAQCRPS